MDPPVDFPAVMPLLEGTFAPCPEGVLATTNVEVVEISSPSLPVLTPALLVSLIRRQSLLAPSVPSSVVDSSLPHSPQLAGPSLLEGTYLGDDGALDLRADVHSDASIFHEKLAEDLLNHTLLLGIRGSGNFSLPTRSSLTPYVKYMG